RGTIQSCARSQDTYAIRSHHARIRAGDAGPERRPSPSRRAEKRRSVLDPDHGPERANPRVCESRPAAGDLRKAVDDAGLRHGANRSRRSRQPDLVLDHAARRRVVDDSLRSNMRFTGSVLVLAAAILATSPTLPAQGGATDVTYRNLLDGLK